MSYDRQKSGAAIFESALEKVGNARGTIEYIISTVYGHRLLAFSDKALPEIICHAKGTIFYEPFLNQVNKVVIFDSPRCTEMPIFYENS